MILFTKFRTDSLDHMRRGSNVVLRKKRVAHQIYRAYARVRASVRTLVCKLECKSRMAAAAPPPPPETAWCSRARGALDIARGALGAGARVNSIHPRASGTNSRRRSLHSRAPRRWRHRGRSAPPGARALVARLISPAARSERAGGSIQSTHERLEPTAGGAVSTVEHPGDGAAGGVRHRLVLACSWRSCERVRRAQSGCETRLNESASVWWMCGISRPRPLPIRCCSLECASGIALPRLSAKELLVVPRLMCAFLQTAAFLSGPRC